MSDPLDFSAFEAAALQNTRGSRNSVRFYTDTVPNKAKSDKAGHPVYDTIERAMVRVPGSRDETPVRIDDKFMAEYGPLYERWKKTQEQPVDGVPLEQWAPLPKALVEEWKFFGVRSVQDLANLSDTNAQKMGMGVIEWRKKAQAWLEQAADHASSQRLVSENEQLKREIERLTKQVNDIAAKADAVKAAPAPTMDIAAIAAAVALLQKNGAAQ
jgi:hypothetical protein